jgi:hypothetical protein
LGANFDAPQVDVEFRRFGIAMALGVLLGLIPIPIPGVGVVTLGIGGGPLIVALILGKPRRTGSASWACSPTMRLNAAVPPRFAWSGISARCEEGTLGEHQRFYSLCSRQAIT